MKDLNKTTRLVRRDVLGMVYRAKASHIGSAFSCVDILCVLFDKVLRINPKDPKNSKRDRFFFSKGHACTALYAILAEKKFFDKALLMTYTQNDSILTSHISNKVPGIELSTGSLGHALPVAVGVAIAAKLRKERWKTFVFMSDGELNEGSNWEAFLFAPTRMLDNLIAIIDSNKFQAMGKTKNIIDCESLEDKLLHFKWNTIRIDGHDLVQIENVLQKARKMENGKPTVIIADTIKGKGVSFMEDANVWHYKSPNDEEYELALKELNI
jgi:transketolase